MSGELRTTLWMRRLSWQVVEFIMLRGTRSKKWKLGQDELERMMPDILNFFEGWRDEDTLVSYVLGMSITVYQDLMQCHSQSQNSRFSSNYVPVYMDDPLVFEYSYGRSNKTWFSNYIYIYVCIYTVVQSDTFFFNRPFSIAMSNQRVGWCFCN